MNALLLLLHPIPLLLFLSTSRGISRRLLARRAHQSKDTLYTTSTVTTASFLHLILRKMIFFFIFFILLLACSLPVSLFSLHHNQERKKENLRRHDEESSSSPSSPSSSRSCFSLSFFSPKLLLKLNSTDSSEITLQYTKNYAQPQQAYLDIYLQFVSLSTCLLSVYL